MTLENGSQLGRYVVRGRIGAGGMGEVWRAEDEAASAAEQTRLGLAEALLLAGRPDEGSSEAAVLLEAFPESIEALGLAGVLAARLGDAAEARRIDQRLRTTDQNHLYGRHTYLRACIAAQLGEAEQAMALLRQAFSEGQSFGVSLHRDPGLEPLHGDPPFEALIHPQG